MITFDELLNFKPSRWQLEENANDHPCPKCGHNMTVYPPFSSSRDTLIIYCRVCDKSKVLVAPESQMHEESLNEDVDAIDLVYYGREINL